MKKYTIEIEEADLWGWSRKRERRTWKIWKIRRNCSCWQWGRGHSSNPLWLRAWTSHSRWRRLGWL